MSITFSYLLLEHVSYVYRAITKKILWNNSDKDMDQSILQKKKEGC